MTIQYYTSLVQKFCKTNPLRAVYILFGLFALMVYTPYLVSGGLVYDDWSVARLSSGCPGLQESYSCYWPNYAHRPLAPVYYSLTSNAFHGWAPGYIFVSVSIWLAGIMAVFTVLRRKFGLAFATPFLFLAAIPSVSSSIIFSPGMQSVGAVAFAVWAASFVLLDAYLRTNNKKQLWASFALMLGSLLFYESSLPLFALSLAWPYIIKPPKKLRDKTYWKHYALRFTAPAIAIVGAVLFYQKVFIVAVQHSYANLTKFQIVGSGLDTIDFGIRVIINDIWVFTVGLVMFIGQGLVHIRHYNIKTLLNVAAILLVAGVALYIAKKYQPKIKAQGSFPWIVIAAVALGVGAMYFVSLVAPTFVGYLNRGMVAGSIVVALAGAVIWHKLGQKRAPIVMAGVAILFAGYLASFIVQRNNFIHSANDKKAIQADILPKLQPLYGQKIFVVAYVPTYLGANFNNEVVFSDEVLDWAHFLYIKSGGRDEIRGISLSAERLKRGELEIKDGKLRAMGDFAPLDTVWFYNASTKEFRKITSEADLQYIIDHAPSSKGALPADGKTRAKLSEWLASY